MSVLAHSELHRRLKQGEVFRQDTWAYSQIRGASYDLRVAEDFLVVPDLRSSSNLRYQRGKLRKHPVILNPGDVAFVSTKERLCMPWDLAGLIGIKFTYARKGVLVLTGLTVDPGFGLEKSGDGWAAKEDERLHFVLANVGPAPVELLPGSQSIATMTLVALVGSSPEIGVESTKDMQEEFFSDGPPGLSLAFFTKMAELQVGYRNISQRFEVVEKGTSQLVMFGIYLLAAAIIAAAVSILVAIASSDQLTLRVDTLRSLVPTTPGPIVGSLVVVIAFVVMTRWTVAAVNAVTTGMVRVVYSIAHAIRSK